MTIGQPDHLRDDTLQRWEKLPPRDWMTTFALTFTFVGVCTLAWVILSKGGAQPSHLFVDIALLSLLTALTAFDIRHHILPDALTLSLVLFGVFWNYWQNSEWMLPILGGLIGYSVFWLLGTIWQKRTGNTGLGLGDAKLLAGAGALLGPFLLPYIVLLSSGLALASIFSMRVVSKSSSDLVVFGPFICAAMWILWAAGA